MPEIPENEKALLESLGFKPDAGYPKLYNLQVDEDTIASVDYRKVNGRRFARRKGSFVDDPDEIEVLRKFKEEKDKLQSSSAECIAELPAGASGHDFTTAKTKLGTPDTSKSLNQHNDLETKDSRIGGGLPPLIPQSPPPIPSPANQINLYSFLYSLIDAGGIAEIFGDTGSLKSQFCTEICKHARQAKKTFYYIDTEGKVGLMNKKFLGKDYKYIPKWHDIVGFVKAVPKYDVLVIDSIGFPISAKAAGLSLDQQGQAWNDMMSLVGDILKAWAYDNSAIVIITNQPKSDFMKNEEELKRICAVGDKVHFAPNIILRARKTIIPGHYDKGLKKVIPPISVGTFTSHRSTDFMDDVEILSLLKNDEDIRVDVPTYITERMRKILNTDEEIK